MINDGVIKTDKKITSFLMVGQSNMAGRGEIDDVPPIKNDLCFMLRMGRWQPMSEPVNPDRAISGIRFHSGISLAPSFADEFAKHTSSAVGLIPCADGGTSISQWLPGGVLFDHAVMMTKLAMRTSELGGIIWHQGETDCQGELNTQIYAQHFLTVMNGFRRELGIKDLPIIIGELSENTADVWKMNDNIKRMNSLLHELKSEIPYCEIASADGLMLKSDGLHFNSASCRILGGRYFKAYMKLVDR